MVFFPKMVDMANTPKEIKEDAPEPVAGLARVPEFADTRALGRDEVSERDLDRHWGGAAYGARTP